MNLENKRNHLLKFDFQVTRNFRSLLLLIYLFGSTLDVLFIHEWNIPKTRMNISLKK